ncbi:MAG: galactose-1-phosphate uridylyltransferase [Alphaproteobacteria bacterium]
MSADSKNFYYHHVTKNDGRSLHLFSEAERTYNITNELEPTENLAQPFMCHHPLRDEWVIYSTGRQNRTLNPPKEYCPLCAVAKDAFPGEVAVEDFEVAIFDNRFTSLSLDAHIAPELGIKTAPAKGKCEVIVYSSEHEGNLGQMPDSRRALLIHAWTHRYNELRQNPDLEYIFPFENRGKEVGVTLPHPHGQLYAFNHLPPNIKKMKAAFEKNQALLELYFTTHGKNNIWEDEYFVAWVPPVARYPFETWLMPKEPMAGPWEFNNDDIASLAHGLGVVQRKLDGLFERNMPYIMGLYAAPQGMEDKWHFHIQFLPFLRDANKMKYIAGIEQSLGLFLSDISPEDMAKKLRKIEV